jgi:hypothetical protein
LNQSGVNRRQSETKLYRRRSGHASPRQPSRPLLVFALPRLLASDQASASTSTKPDYSEPDFTKPDYTKLDYTKLDYADLYLTPAGYFRLPCLLARLLACPCCRRPPSPFPPLASEWSWSGTPTH